MRRPRGKCLTVFLVFIALVLIAGAFAFIGLSKKKTALAHFQKAYQNDISSIKVGFIKSAGALPIYSMLRLNSGTRMNVKLVAFPDYQSMWEMMCSGNIDYCLAASEEYALAVPRLKPGSIICALSEDSTNAIAIADPAPESISRIVFAQGLTGQAAAIKFCNSRQIAAKLIPACEKDIPGIMIRREADAAVCDPITAAKLSNVNIISGETPVTVCLVSSGSSELEGASRAEFLLSKWFTIAKRLSINANSAIKAISEDAEMPQAEVAANLENLHVLTQEEALEKTQSLRPAIISAINDWAFAGAFREPVKQKKYSEDSLVNSSYLKEYCKKSQNESGSTNVAAIKKADAELMPELEAAINDPIEGNNDVAGAGEAAAYNHESSSAFEDTGSAARQKKKKRIITPNTDKSAALPDAVPPQAKGATSEVSREEMEQLHHNEQGYNSGYVVEHVYDGPFETSDETREPENSPDSNIKSPKFGQPTAEQELQE